MAEFNPLVAALTSTLAFFAVMLGAMWLGPFWDSYSRQHIASFMPSMKSLGMDQKAIEQWMRVWGATIFAIIVLLGIVRPMIPVAVGLAYLVFISPGYILAALIKGRRVRLRDQLVQVAVGLTNSSRAGLVLEDGFKKMAEQIEDPMAKPLGRVMKLYGDNIPFEDALRTVEQELKLESFTIFTTALLVCRETGGKDTYALERISSGLLELQRLERKLESESASGRRLAFLLGLFPLFFMAGFTLLDPESMSYLYNKFFGQLILLGIGVMVFLAVQWCMHILNLDF